MIFTRKWAMPNKDTFSVPPIGDFVCKYLAGTAVSVDPFARNCNWATFTNDINPNTTAGYHLDAADFVRKLIADGVRADTFIFDPPYSPTQIARSYQEAGLKATMTDTQNGRMCAEMYDLATEMLKPNGTILSFGWNSSGAGVKRGFELVELLLVCHGPGHNDTICLAERKIPLPLLER